MSLKDKVNALPHVPEDESGGGGLFSHFEALIGWAAGSGKLAQDTFTPFTLGDDKSHDEALEIARQFAKAEGKRANKTIMLKFPSGQSWALDGTPKSWTVESMSSSAQPWMTDSKDRKGGVNLFNFFMEALDNAGIETLPFKGFGKIAYIPDPREGEEAYQDREVEEVVDGEKVKKTVRGKRLLWLPVELYPDEATMKAAFSTSGDAGKFEFGANALEGLTIPEMFKNNPLEWANAAPEILGKLGGEWTNVAKLSKVAKAYYDVDEDGVKPIKDLVANRSRFGF